MWFGVLRTTRKQRHSSHFLIKGVLVFGAQMKNAFANHCVLTYYRMPSTRIWYRGNLLFVCVV